MASSRVEFKGMGEFLLNDIANANDLDTKKSYAVAAKNKLAVLPHVDDTAIDLLMTQAPDALLIWAHTVIGGALVSRVDDLLKKVPATGG